jgi:hypothetical protein
LQLQQFASDEDDNYDLEEEGGLAVSDEQQN